MNSLESRKHLLIAESELNRAHLVRDITALSSGVRMLTARAKSFGSIASSAAMLVAGLAAFHREKAAGANTKHFWLQSLLKQAGLISTLWLAFRSRGKNSNQAR